MSTSKGKAASTEELAEQVKRLTIENAELKANQGPTIVNPKDPLRVPTPTPYEGKTGTLRTFLTQARLYLKFQQSALPFQTDRVLAVAAYLKGDAAAWFEPMLREYLEKGHPDKCNDRTRRIVSHYDRFEGALKEAFGNPDEERDWERQLLQLKQATSAQEYAAKFRQVAAHLEWDDDPLMVQFYKGLKNSVKDDLIKENRPDTLGAYMERAIRIDNRNYERRMEMRHEGWVPKGAHPNRGKGGRPRTAWGQGAGPMELDAALRKEETRKCYNCGKAGHLARACRKPKKPFARVPEGKRGVNAAFRTNEPFSTVDHNTLSWTSCYDDDCTIHKSDKDGANWYPKEPNGTRTVAVLQQEPLEEEEDDIETFNHPPQPSHFGIVPGKTPGRPAPSGLLQRTTLAGVKMLDAKDKPSQNYLGPLDDPRLGTDHPEHSEVAWMVCLNDRCHQHLPSKVREDFFPRRPWGSHQVRHPYLAYEMEHWVMAQRIGEQAIFEIHPHVPLECLTGENKTYEDCDTHTCKLHMQEKADAWHNRLRLRHSHRRGSVVVKDALPREEWTEAMTTRLEEGLGKIAKRGTDAREYIAKWAEVSKVMEHLSDDINRIVSATDAAQRAIDTTGPGKTRAMENALHAITDVTTPDVEVKGEPGAPPALLTFGNREEALSYTGPAEPSTSFHQVYKEAYQKELGTGGPRTIINARLETAARDYGRHKGFSGTPQRRAAEQEAMRHLVAHPEDREAVSRGEAPWKKQKKPTGNDRDRK